MAVRKKGDKWAVVHCSKGKKGKVIAYHDTKKEAMAQHKAIMANKKRRKK
jgi:hypothetical protein